MTGVQTCALPISEHWFWDAEKSGGIFVEHGVHFFDLFEMWFGEGRFMAGQHGQRRQTGMYEQVQATVCYENDVLVNFYHGFHQPSHMDRQEFRIVFERGDLRLTEWVPTNVTVDALITMADADRLADLFHNVDIEPRLRLTSDQQRVTGRHQTYDAEGRFVIRGDVGMAKQKLYGETVRALMADQLKYLRDRDHQRRIDEGNGLRSLQLAVAAADHAKANYVE